MSLLEDVFLQDEANEAEELERVIEGDEFEERRRSDSDENSEKEDEAEEDKRRVDPTKTKTTRVVKNPRFLLNPARLTGPRGIQVIPEHFKDFKFKGKGHEKEDLDLVLKRLEHWAYRLYPKFQFEDCLKKIEMLGKKRPVAVHLHKIRSDQFLSEDTVVQKDSSDEDMPTPVQEEDEFDKLLQQQIDLARSTPAPNSAKKPDYNGSISPKDKRTTSLMMPKATSSPSINDEQRERMLRSRRLAEERRLARQKTNLNTNNTESTSDTRLVSTNNQRTDFYVENIESRIVQSEDIDKDINEMGIIKKHNRSNVIDSSDEETVVQPSVSVAVDVHTVNKIVEEEVVENEESVFNMVEGGVKEIQNDTEKSKHSFCNSNSKIIECNKLITVSNDEIEKDDDSIEKNMSQINNVQNTVNFKFNDGKTGELNVNDKLRCDDPHVNKESNENGDISVKNNENIIIDHVGENIRILNEVHNNGNELEKHALCSTERACNINNDNDNFDSRPVETNNDVMDEKNDITNDVPEEIIEDIMDVDFSDDF